MKKTHRRLRLFAPLLALLLAAPLAMAAPDDSEALRGIEKGKIFFDVNLTQPEPLVLYLNVIRQTRESLLAQGVSPDFIVAFRGLSVKFVTRDLSGVPSTQQPTYQAIAQLISELEGMGIRFQACAVATGLFGVDNASILPEVTVVGNTFISSMAYQSKRNGYAVIPVM